MGAIVIDSGRARVEAVVDDERGSGAEPSPNPTRRARSERALLMRRKQDQIRDHVLPSPLPPDLSRQVLLIQRILLQEL
jgi:hypothetical protein